MGIGHILGDVRYSILEQGKEKDDIWLGLGEPCRSGREWDTRECLPVCPLLFVCPLCPAVPVSGRKERWPFPAWFLVLSGLHGGHHPAWSEGDSVSLYFTVEILLSIILCCQSSISWWNRQGLPEPWGFWVLLWF